MSPIIHFRKDRAVWTLCGILDIPHFIEGGEEAEGFFRYLDREGHDSICPICRRKLENPKRRVELPDLEFKAVCDFCEEADDHIEAVTIAVKIDTAPPDEQDRIVWCRCSRCGCGRPCSIDVAIEAWSDHLRQQHEEEKERCTGL